MTTSGSFEHRFRELALQVRHVLVGDALRGLGDGLDHAGVLHRKESLRDQDVEQNGQGERQDRDQQGRRLAVQHPVQRPAIARDDGVENLFGLEIEARPLATPGDGG